MSAALGRPEARPRAAWLERLVLAPIGTAVVPAAGWRRDQPAVPDTALPSLLAIIRHGLGDQMAAADARARDRTPAGLLALGGVLWPAAGRLLQVAQCPAEWASDTRLTPPDFEALRASVGQLLSRAASLEGFVAHCDPSRPPPDPRHVRTMLDELARGGAPGFGLGLVVLLRRCPRQENLAALALSTGRGDDEIEEAAASSASHVLDAAVAAQQRASGLSQADLSQGRVGSAPPDPRALAREIVEAAALIRCLEAMVALRPMSRMQREVGRKRVVLQAVCLDRFEDCVARLLLQPLAAGSPGQEASAGLRAVAVELGRVGDALRQLGDRYGTERAIQRAGQRARALLGDADPQGGLSAGLLARLGGDAPTGAGSGR